MTASNFREALNKFTPNLFQVASVKISSFSKNRRIQGYYQTIKFVKNLRQKVLSKIKMINNAGSELLNGLTRRYTQATAPNWRFSVGDKSLHKGEGS